LVFDEVTDKNKLMAFYGQRCTYNITGASLSSAWKPRSQKDKSAV